MLWQQASTLAEKTLVSIPKLLVVVLAVATTLLPAPGSQEADLKPSPLNIEKLISELPRLGYDVAVLNPLHLAQKAAQEAAEERKVMHQRQLEQMESERVVQAAQASGDCYEAMKATWPQALWANASIVMQRESSATSNKIGPTLPDGSIGHNADGSQDFGCFQINNFAHAGFFAAHNWADPYQNAAYAYTIYAARGNWSAWYAVRGILW